MTITGTPAGLVTGTPVGNLVAPEELYIEGSPYVFVQDYRAGPYFQPDANGYYWGLSGTATYPVYQLGCIQDVKMTEDVTINKIRCDTVGNKDAIQRRNSLDLEFTMNSVFPLNISRLFTNFSVPTIASHVEMVGMSKINNRQYWQIYCPKVYDDVTGAWIMAHFHRVKFVGNFSWSFGLDGWKITGLKAEAMIDETKPFYQMFGTLGRFDATAL